MLEDIEQHPGSQLMQMLFAYGSTKDILSVNGYEVLRFIEEIESGRFADVALNQERRLEYRDFENHLLRYFHNFLAGAGTLIDHTRIMMNSERISKVHRKAYQKKIDALFSNDLSGFIKRFRNYIVHCGLPKLSHKYMMNEDQWVVTLDLKELSKWSGWTAPAKSFLSAHPDEIRLSWLVATYQDLTIELHEWLIPSFMEHYKESFADLDKLKTKSL